MTIKLFPSLAVICISVFMLACSGLDDPLIAVHAKDCTIETIDHAFTIKNVVVFPLTRE